MVGVRDTSIVCYNDLINSSQLGDLQVIVFNSFLAHPNSTDSEVADFLGYADPNIVRPRRKELLDLGFVVDVGQRSCSVTGRLAHVWRVSTFEEIESFKPVILAFLSNAEMNKIQKLLLKANSYQKNKIIEWCNG